MSAINVPKNFSLFRVNKTNGNMLGRNYSYFVFGDNAVNIVTKQYAKFEGNKIHEYKTSRPLTLLDMSDLNVIKFIMKRGNANVKNSVHRTFMIKNGKVVRNSNLTNDLAVSRFICTMFKDIDGYYAPPLEKPNGTHFHQEIMLCKPIDKVTHIGHSVPVKALNPPSKRRFENSNYTFATAKKMRVNNNNVTL